VHDLESASSDQIKASVVLRSRWRRCQRVPSLGCVPLTLNNYFVQFIQRPTGIGRNSGNDNHVHFGLGDIYSVEWNAVAQRVPDEHFCFEGPEALGVGGILCMHAFHETRHIMEVSSGESATDGRYEHGDGAVVKILVARSVDFREQSILLLILSSRQCLNKKAE
jgi:hypothetical protein